MTVMDRQSAERILQEFRSKKILVVGDVGVDRYTLGLVERISPEAPVPIVHVQSENLKLGLAANVADNINALQAKSLLCGVIGTDSDAEDFKALLKESQIDAAHLVSDAKRRTVLKERVVSENQQLLRVDYESLGLVSQDTLMKVIDVSSQAVELVDAVIFEDYHKGLASELLFQKLSETCQKHNKKCLVDPHSDTPLSFYKGASLLSPNKKEAEKLTGVKILNHSDLEKAGKVFLDQLGTDTVITLGKEGMALITPKHPKPVIIPTEAREVFDVSGAGDTVIAVLSLALSSGCDLNEAAFLANVAAAIEVSKRGTATVSPDEILSFIDQLHSK